MSALSLQMKKQHRNWGFRSLWGFGSAIDEFAGKTFRAWAGKICGSYFFSARKE